MRDQIQAIYDIANYLDDKCPGCGVFYYVWGMDPYVALRGIDEDMATTVIAPQVKEIGAPVNLDVQVRVVRDDQEKMPVSCVSIGSDLMVWESIFPIRHAIPPVAPVEWLLRQLQEQLYPRVTGFTEDLT